MMFASMEQRIAWTYLDRLPPFLPASGAIPAEEQKGFYDRIRSLYEAIYENPMLLVKALHPDDAFPNRFTKSSYGKPELQKYMKKMQDEIEALLKALYQIGRGDSDVKIKQTHKALLDKLHIDLDGSLPEGWRWMANREGASLATFSFCWFEQDSDAYAISLYARMLGDENAFRKLIDWLKANGYQHFICANAIGSTDKLSVTYANMKWNPAPPKGSFEYGVKHSGVAMRYEPFFTAPPVLGLCIPGGMKPYLSAFDQMPPRLQAFVAYTTKQCDACGYCTQTDKTGNRPRAYVLTEYEGKTYPLCTYFPGYRYCWETLSEGIVDDIIAFLSFMDGFCQVNPHV